MEKTQNKSEEISFLKKNKFILGIISLIIFIVAFSFLRSGVFGKNPESAVVLINGIGYLNDASLKIEKRYVLSQGDVVESQGDDSLVVIEWADGSLTRVGGNSSLRIDENMVDLAQGKIQIAFHLLSGRSWSNVISFIGEESYFKQSFRDSEAGVRGTTFNVDLDNNYLYVTDHEVDLETVNGEHITVGENEPLSLSNFSFIDLTEFINNIKNKAWEDINEKFDKEYMEKLQAELLESLKKNNPVRKFQKIYSKAHAAGLTLEEKMQVYKEMLEEYQKYNFVSGTQQQLFTKKQELRELILNYAPEEEKVNHLRYTLYDFQELASQKQYELMENVVPLLEENAEKISEINSNFWEKQTVIPQSLLQTMSKNLRFSLGIFDGSSTLPPLSELDTQTVKESASGLKDAAEQKIHEGLDSLFNRK